MTRSCRTRGTPWAIPPMTRSCGRVLISKASGLDGPPGPARASTPKPESVCLTILCLSPSLLTLTGGYPRPPFSGKNINLRLQLINLLGMKGVFQTPCQHSSLLGRFIKTLATLLSQCLLPNSRIPYPLCSWEYLQSGCRKNKQQPQHQQHQTLN